MERTIKNLEFAVTGTDAPAVPVGQDLFIISGCQVPSWARSEGRGTQLHQMEMLGLCLCHLGAAGETEAKKHSQCLSYCDPAKRLVCACPHMFCLQACLRQLRERAQIHHHQGSVISFCPGVVQAKVFICTNASFKGWSQCLSPDKEDLLSFLLRMGVGIGSHSRRMCSSCPHPSSLPVLQKVLDPVCSEVWGVSAGPAPAAVTSAGRVEPPERWRRWSSEPAV